MIQTQVIYIIGAAEGPVKIGIANSLLQRLGDLQVGNPETLICHHFARIPRSSAVAVEQAAHRAFADRHRRGEWFNVDWREAAEVIDELAAVEMAIASRQDMLSILQAEFGMKPEGRQAVFDYLDRQDRADAYVLHANGYIQKRLGIAACAAFSLVVGQQKNLSGLSPRETKAAMKALADAINVLCNFRLRHARAANSAAVHREVRYYVASTPNPRRA